MYDLVDVSQLNSIVSEEDVNQHIFELYTVCSPPSSSDLGFEDRTQNEIEVYLEKSDITLRVRQSPSELSSKTRCSSTGFVCWKTALLVTDWIYGSPLCPFNAISKKGGDLELLELGSGIGGVSAAVLGPLVRRYICSDQKHVLKLMKENILANIPSSKFDSITLLDLSLENKKGSFGARIYMHKRRPVIECIEYDWEFNDRGFDNYREVTEKGRPDLILSFDTIYNTYLISPFVSTLKSLLRSDNGALIGIQLRDESVVSAFIDQVLDSNLYLFSIPQSMLTEKLKRGYVVYYINAKGSSP